MSRPSLLVVTLSLGLAFTLGLLCRERGDVPGAEYAAQIEVSRAAARALEAKGESSRTYAIIAQRLRPSVVSIYGETADGRRTSSGSGVILDAQGHVLTNLHVIDGMQTRIVTLSSHERYLANVEGIDAPTDLAVLQINAGEGLQAVAFGDSEGLVVGEEVLAIGNALGFGWSVTKGIISSLHRSTLHLEGDLELGRYQDFIQTDASINPGNSGGPLVNMRGEVIGINSLIVSGEEAGGKIGFAIPSRDAVFVARELMQHGEVVRGFLGIRARDVREMTRSERRSHDIAVMHGALVSYVLPGSPADHAGLGVGDVILAMNDLDVPDFHALRSRVARTRVDSGVDLTVLREGQRRKVRAVLSKRTES